MTCPRCGKSTYDIDDEHMAGDTHLNCMLEAKVWDGRTVLITGGTGSLGTAIADLLLTLPITALRIYSRDEYKQAEFQAQRPDPRLRLFIGDVRDGQRLRRALSGASVAIHAAALKRTDSIEYNALEAVHTNITGTENVVNACIDQGVEHAVLISSDKAVRPVSIYGATKMIAEQLFLRPYSGAQGPAFSVVRLGNLVGSRGSLVPLIQAQRATGVVTLTHPGMTRYWMTLPDAARFVLDTVEKPAGLYTPRLPSVRVPDVLAAIAPECEVRVIGPRAGERLYEALDASQRSDTNDWWLDTAGIRRALTGVVH